MAQRYRHYCGVDLWESPRRQNAGHNIDGIDLDYPLELQKGRAGPMSWRRVIPKFVNRRGRGLRDKDSVATVDIIKLG
ncbi:predicted protein [Uncinocarpus reesii 1704]|uniref:Uncharacterized protein n=1 Tax=Uncinocarpus reesii (strain UAMH 1704) TaxID=336963 RepID=C4JQ72_UNCRE|nr:uncharacterized protein UREG_03305 [Uncinocarpus reesii 1704]EEP78459.1 predicted protein [Uncinocarpus reesii 1704]